MRKLRVLHITSLYPDECEKRNGIAVKNLIQSIPNNINNLEIDSTVFKMIPYSTFPLNLLKNKWSCYLNLRKKAKYDNDNNIKFVASLVFPNSKFMILTAKLQANIVISILNRNKRSKFDIVHCHTSYKDGYIGRMLNKKFKIPYIVTTRREIDFNVFTKRKKEQIFIKKNIEKAKVITSPSVHLKNKCLKYTQNNSILVPNGIFDSLIIKDLKKKRSRFQILFN